MGDLRDYQVNSTENYRFQISNKNIIAICFFFTGLLLSACTPFIHYDFTSYKKSLETGQFRVELGSAIRLKPKRNQQPSEFYSFKFYFDTPREDIQAIKIHINYLKNISGQPVLINHSLPEKTVSYTKHPKYSSHIKNYFGQYGAHLSLNGLELKFEDHRAEFKITIYGKENIVEEKIFKLYFATDYYESIIEHTVQ